MTVKIVLVLLTLSLALASSQLASCNDCLGLQESKCGATSGCFFSATRRRCENACQYPNESSCNSCNQTCNWVAGVIQTCIVRWDVSFTMCFVVDDSESIDSGFPITNTPEWDVIRNVFIKGVVDAVSPPSCDPANPATSRNCPRVGVVQFNLDSLVVVPEITTSDPQYAKFGNKSVCFGPSTIIPVLGADFNSRIDSMLRGVDRDTGNSGGSTFTLRGVSRCVDLLVNTIRVDPRAVQLLVLESDGPPNGPNSGCVGTCSACEKDDVKDTAFQDINDPIFAQFVEHTECELRWWNGDNTTWRGQFERTNRDIILQYGIKTYNVYFKSDTNPPAPLLQCLTNINEPKGSQTEVTAADLLGFTNNDSTAIRRVIDGAVKIGNTICEFETLPPTQSPSLTPTSNPTQNPSKKPTQNPTSRPTGNPTKNPTNDPTSKPTSNPTQNPTRKPSADPSKNPTGNPTALPTGKPTSSPTTNPTKNPTRNPTTKPSANPTANPTLSPTTCQQREVPEFPRKNCVTGNGCTGSAAVVTVGNNNQPVSVTTNTAAGTTTVCYNLNLVNNGGTTTPPCDVTNDPMTGVSFIIDECCPAPTMEFLASVSVSSGGSSVSVNRAACVQGDSTQAFNSQCTRTSRSCVANPGAMCSVLNLNDLNVLPSPSVQYCITVQGTNYDVVSPPNELDANVQGKAKFCFERGSTTPSGPTSVCTCVEVGFISSERLCNNTPSPSANPSTNPTKNPTSNPTQKPTANPTQNPTPKPTQNPTAKPSPNPSNNPTNNPTSKPTVKPTQNPTSKPTQAPTTCLSRNIPDFTGKDCSDTTTCTGTNAIVTVTNSSVVTNQAAGTTKLCYQISFNNAAGGPCSIGNVPVRGISLVTDECCPAPDMEFLDTVSVTSPGGQAQYNRVECAKGGVANAFDTPCARTTRPCIAKPGSNCAVLNVNGLSVAGPSFEYCVTVAGTGYDVADPIGVIDPNAAGQAKICFERGSSVPPGSNVCSCVDVGFIKSDRICTVTPRPTKAPTNNPTANPTNSPTTCKQSEVPNFKRKDCTQANGCTGSSALVSVGNGGEPIATLNGDGTTTVCYDLNLVANPASPCDGAGAQAMTGVSFIIDECCPTPMMEFFETVSISGGGAGSTGVSVNREACVEGTSAQTASSQCTRTSRPCQSDSAQQCTVLNLNNLAVTAGASAKYCIKVQGEFDVVAPAGQLDPNVRGKAKFCFERGSTTPSGPTNVCTCVEVGFIESPRLCKATFPPSSSPTPPPDCLIPPVFPRRRSCKTTCSFPTSNWNVSFVDRVVSTDANGSVSTTFTYAASSLRKCSNSKSDSRGSGGRAWTRSSKKNRRRLSTWKGGWSTTPKPSKTTSGKSGADKPSKKSAGGKQSNKSDNEPSTKKAPSKKTSGKDSKDNPSKKSPSKKASSKPSKKRSADSGSAQPVNKKSTTSKPSKQDAGKSKSDKAASKKTSSKKSTKPSKKQGSSKKSDGAKPTTTKQPSQKNPGKSNSGKPSSKASSKKTSKDGKKAAGEKESPKKSSKSNDGKPSTKKVAPGATPSKKSSGGNKSDGSKPSSKKTATTKVPSSKPSSKKTSNPGSKKTSKKVSKKQGASPCDACLESWALRLDECCGVGVLEDAVASGLAKVSVNGQACGDSYRCKIKSNGKNGDVIVVYGTKPSTLSITVPGDVELSRGGSVCAQAKSACACRPMMTPNTCLLPTRSPTQKPTTKPSPPPTRKVTKVDKKQGSGKNSKSGSKSKPVSKKGLGVSSTKVPSKKSGKPSKKTSDKDSKNKPSKKSVSKKVTSKPSKKRSADSGSGKSASKKSTTTGKQSSGKSKGNKPASKSKQDGKKNVQGKNKKSSTGDNGKGSVKASSGGKGKSNQGGSGSGKGASSKSETKKSKGGAKQWKASKKTYGTHN